MNYNPNKHNRRSIRLKGYDYSQAGLYFITICCQDRTHLFGTVQNGEMILNEFGKIAYQEWANTPNIRDNIRLHEFIIMPNHIHGIIEILFEKEKGSQIENIGKFKSPSQTIGSIIRGYKIATIKKIKDYINNQNLEDSRKSENSGAKEAENSGAKEAEKKMAKERESTGELQFAPTSNQFAPTSNQFAPTSNQFAPAYPSTATAKIQELDFKIWQRNYYDNIIRDYRAFINISNYIINNPAKWEGDKFNSKKKH